MCMAALEGWTGEGRLLLETDDLIFRGARRLAVPLKEVRSAEARDGWLLVSHTGGVVRFDLGDAAARWAHAITNPRTRADKLGVRAGSRVLLHGLEDDAAFVAELRARTDAIDSGGSETGYDLVFVRVEDVADLARLGPLAGRIGPAGGIWIVHPKGRPDLSHETMVAAAKAAGLVDNKTARFSDTHTALRFVIPRARR